MILSTSSREVSEFSYAPESNDAILDPVGSKGDTVARLRTTFDLFEAGEALMRQKLRRQHPEATDHELEVELVTWFSSRPIQTGVHLRFRGVDLGDC